MSDIEIVCGPHRVKRHGSEFAKVARASATRGPGIPSPHVRLFGVVEQRAYESDAGEMWDEYVAPLYPELVTASERRRFDARWDDALEPLNAVFGGEVALRQRAVLRCPVCAESLPVGDADELREVVDKLVAGGIESVTLSGLRRALDLNKNG